MVLLAFLANKTSSRINNTSNDFSTVQAYSKLQGKRSYRPNSIEGPERQTCGTRGTKPEGAERSNPRRKRDEGRPQQGRRRHSRAAGTELGFIFQCLFSTRHTLATPAASPAGRPGLLQHSHRHRRTGRARSAGGLTRPAQTGPAQTGPRAPPGPRSPDASRLPSGLASPGCRGHSAPSRPPRALPFFAPRQIALAPPPAAPLRQARGKKARAARAPFVLAGCRGGGHSGQ